MRSWARNLSHWSSVKLPKKLLLLTLKVLLMPLCWEWSLLQVLCTSPMNFFIHFMSLISFYILLKISENKRFSHVYKGIEIDQWHEMDSGSCFCRYIFFSKFVKKMKVNYSFTRSIAKNHTHKKCFGNKIV